VEVKVILTFNFTTILAQGEDFLKVSVDNPRSFPSWSVMAVRNLTYKTPAFMIRTVPCNDTYLPPHPVNPTNSDNYQTTAIQVLRRNTVSLTRGAIESDAPEGSRDFDVSC
jgi:hypothetical protein